MGHVLHSEGVLARVHSESWLGDVFGAVRCDSGSQLDAALAALAARGAGVLVYLRGGQGPQGQGRGSRVAVCEQPASALHSPPLLPGCSVLVWFHAMVPTAATSCPRPLPPAPASPSTGGRARLRRGRAHPARPRRHLGGAAHQQPGQDQLPQIARHQGHRGRAAFVASSCCCCSAHWDRGGSGGSCFRGGGGSRRHPPEKR